MIVLHLTFTLTFISTLFIETHRTADSALAFVNFGLPFAQKRDSGRGGWAVRRLGVVENTSSEDGRSLENEKAVRL